MDVKGGLDVRVLRYPRGSMKFFQKWKGTTYIGVFEAAEHDGGIHFIARCRESPPPLPDFGLFWAKNGYFEVKTP